jgi:hypothetical protein
MALKSIHINEIDSLNLSVFDAKDNQSFITLKDAPKNWVDDSLFGRTIYTETFHIKSEKPISIFDTFKPQPYFIQKVEVIANQKSKKYVPSIFKHHELKCIDQDVIFRKHPHNDWSLPFFLIGFLLLAIANVYYIKRFSLYVKAFFFNRFVSQLMREDNSQTQRLSILLTFIYLFSVSLFIIKMNDLYDFANIEMNHSWQFLSMVFLVFCFFIGKITLNYLVGFIFKTDKEVSEYTFNLILLNQLLGIGMFFLSFMLFYINDHLTQILLYIGLALLAITYLYRIGRGFFSVRTNKHISAVYLFLYFCTLEILPVVFITKVILDS